MRDPENPQQQQEVTAYGLSGKDREHLRQKSYAALTDDERWRWHAYDRAWRRLFGLGLPSPADPDEKWADREYDREADRVLRAAYPVLAKAQYQRPAPAPKHVVRPHWQKIRGPDLTDAEREIAIKNARRTIELWMQATGAEKFKVDAPPVRRMAAE